MARLSIKITHVAWREGRPRFVPSAALRALGFKGQDLRHADGTWFSPDEALAWSNEIEPQIAQRRHARAQGKRLPKTTPRASFYTVNDLFEDFFKSPRMQGQTIAEGKRLQKAASKKTIHDYRQKRDTLTRFDDLLINSPVDALRQPHVFDLYERLWQAKGLATARGCIAVLSTAISWGMKRGKVKLLVNPCLRLGMEMPEGRIRAGTPDEMRALVIAANAIGRPEIGDNIVLGLWTGQRQNDRLALQDAGLVDGRRLFRQSKTGRIVEIRQAAELEARLTAARQRRQDWRVRPLEIICDEKARTAFKPDHYRHVFAEVRAHAAKTTPSLSDFHDQDLRDTAVTWLARAGCTVPEICHITGHSAASAELILKHYLSQHHEIGDNAIAKLVAWYDGQR